MRPALTDHASSGVGDVHHHNPPVVGIAPALREPGLLWGAAKAHVVLARRRQEGRR